MYDLIARYLSDFKCENEIKVWASIFYAFSLNDIPYPLNRITGLICSNARDTKKLFKLILIFPQKNILSNDICKLAEFLFSQSNFEKEDKNNIVKLLEQYSCKFCSFSPITQISGISYWYFKSHMKKKKSLKSIYESFLFVKIVCICI